MTSWASLFYNIIQIIPPQMSIFASFWTQAPQDKRPSSKLTRRAKSMPQGWGGAFIYLSRVGNYINVAACSRQHAAVIGCSACMHTRRTTCRRRHSLNSPCDERQRRAFNHLQFLFMCFFLRSSITHHTVDSRDTLPISSSV